MTDRLIGIIVTLQTRQNNKLDGELVLHSVFVVTITNCDRLTTECE